jgi:hypothetical protein
MLTQERGGVETMTFQWKEGSRIDADANRVGRELASLGSEIIASDLVKAARKEGSAMHDIFEWDDRVCGEQYRLEQARMILRSIVTVIDRPEEPGEMMTFRSYENVDVATRQESEDGRCRRVYVPTLKALKKSELREQVFARLEADIAEAERTAGKYKYLCDGFGEVERRLIYAREAVRN